MKSAFDRFTEDVAAHEMTVLADDGVRRHVRFARTGTYCMSFDLVTWPGHLCYTGDMGTYVFSRLRDMFEFFRGDRANPDYWSEKCISRDRDGVREFSEERWRRAVLSDMVSFARNHGLTRREFRRLREEVRDEVLSIDSPDHDGVSRAMEYSFTDDSGRRHGRVFPDFYEHRLEDFTFRFLWCCYALPWAIAKYDAAKAETQPAAVTA